MGQHAIAVKAETTTFKNSVKRVDVEEEEEWMFEE